MDDANPDVGQPSPAASSSPTRRALARSAPAFYRRKLPHYQVFDAAHTITFVTKGRMELPEPVRGLVLDVITSGHQIYYGLHAAVVMPDHVHLLLTPGTDDDGDTYGLSQIVSAVKGRSARGVNKALGRSGQIWQPERFDRALRSHERVRAQAEYICQNPVRAGLTEPYPWLWREWVEGSDSAG